MADPFTVAAITWVEGLALMVAPLIDTDKLDWIVATWDAVLHRLGSRVRAM